MRLSLALVAATTLAVACGSRGGGPPTALWSADAGSVANPWPSDRLNTGGRAGTPAGYFSRALPSASQYSMARAYLDQAALVLSSSGGYSVFGPVVVPLSAAVDPTNLVPYVHLFPAGGGPDLPVTVSWVPTLQALEVTPKSPLLEHAGYLLALSGPLLSPAGDFQAALASPPLSSLAAQAVSQGAASSPSDLDLVLSFTTATISSDLRMVQAAIDSPEGVALGPVYGAPPPNAPAFPVGVFASSSATFLSVMHTVGASTGGISLLAQGTWQAYDFRTNSLFDPAKVSGTVTPSQNLVDFRFTIPKGSLPVSGWPVVVVSHGVTGDSTEGLQRASSFALAGVATLALTAPDHGWRGSVIDFFDFTRLLACRDEFRQTEAELLQVDRMIRNANASAAAPFDQIDPSRIFYFGNSFGGIVGAGMAEATTHYRAIGLTVAGGHLTRLFDGSAGQTLIALFGAKLQVSPGDPAFPALIDAFRPLAQWGIDPADGASLGPYTSRARPMLLQESKGDLTIPNLATDELGASLELPLFSTTSGSLAPPRAMWVWDMTQYASELPPGEQAHNLYWNLKEMRHQMEQFLLSDGTRLVDR